MQTVQLLGGAAGRIAFLRRARAHLRPGGLLACAIVTALSRSTRDGDPGPRRDGARRTAHRYYQPAHGVSAER